MGAASELRSVKADESDGLALHRDGVAIDDGDVLRRDRIGVRRRERIAAA